MKALSILLFLVFSISAFSQAELIEQKGSKYIYNGKTYKCKELGEVFQVHQESFDLYTSGRKIVKRANRMAYVGLGLICAGVGAGSLNQSFGTIVFSVLSVGTGLAIELIAIVPRGVGNGRIKKAKKEFNYEMIKRHGYKEDTSLMLGVTQNGLGLVMSF